MSAIAKRFGKPVRLEITMYDPHAGESIFVSNIRLTAEKQHPDAPSKVRFALVPAAHSGDHREAAGQTGHGRSSIGEPSSGALIPEAIGEFGSLHAVARLEEEDLGLGGIDDGSPGADDAGAHAAIITLNDRNHITVLVRNTEISGITLRKLAGAGVIMSSCALQIDKAPAPSRVVLGQQGLDGRSGKLWIAI